ncbi:MAG: hypothetical protein ACLQBK_06790 [Candidatus Sulfotelmatobacter sp.]
MSTSVVSTLSNGADTQLKEESLRERYEEAYLTAVVSQQVTDIMAGVGIPQGTFTEIQRHLIMNLLIDARDQANYILTTLEAIRDAQDHTNSSAAIADLTSGAARA